MCQVSMELYTTISFCFILWQDILLTFYLSYRFAGYCTFITDSKHFLQQRITELVETSHAPSEEEEEDEPKPKKQKQSDAQTSKPTTKHNKTDDKQKTDSNKTTQKAAVQKKNKLADIQTANIHARAIFAKRQTQDEDKLRQQLDDAKEEISSLKEQLTTAQQQLATTQQQLTTTQQQMTTTQNQLLTVQNENQSLGKQLEEVQNARPLTDSSLIPST